MSVQKFEEKKSYFITVFYNSKNLTDPPLPAGDAAGRQVGKGVAKP